MSLNNHQMKYHTTLRIILMKILNYGEALSLPTIKFCA
jgi:hypothetical protein